LVTSEHVSCDSFVVNRVTAAVRDVCTIECDMTDRRLVSPRAYTGRVVADRKVGTSSVRRSGMVSIP
jgi:hypothetical protein